MTTTLASAKAILQADATLLALATGNIYDFDETGRLGINRTNTESSFDNGIIKPCLLLKLASSVPFGEIADDSAKITGVREILEVWAYQDSGYSTIKSMLDRVYTLLQGTQLGGFSCRFAQKVQPPVRDIEMDANVEYDRYAVIALKS